MPHSESTVNSASEGDICILSPLFQDIILNVVFVIGFVSYLSVILSKRKTSVSAKVLVVVFGIMTVFTWLEIFLLGHRMGLI